MSDQQVALVTGASSGIGRETALGLARQGWRVIAAARRLDRLEALAAQEPHIIPRQVDLADPEQVEDFAAWLAAQPVPVTLLVNNAGYALRGAVEDVPLADVRRLYQVNLFSLIRVTQACLPGMRRLRTGRVVNISSMAGRLAFPGNATYASSKFALEAYCDAMRLEVEGFGIKVIAVRPGPVATEFVAVAAAMTGDRYQDASPDYQPVYQRIQAMFHDFFFGKPIPGPAEVAAVVLRAALEPDPAPSYSAGAIAEEFLALRARLDDAQLLEHFRKLMGFSH